VTQQPKSGLGGLIARLWGTHTHTRTHTRARRHPVELLWTSDQPVAEAATYTTHNEPNIRKTMSLAGFELAMTTIKRLRTYALDRKNTGITYKTQLVHRILRQLITKQRFTTYYLNIHLHLDLANNLFLWVIHLKCFITLHISSHRRSPFLIDLKIGSVICKVTLSHKMSKLTHP
jgi:hypothetical protein